MTHAAPLVPDRHYHRQNNRLRPKAEAPGSTYALRLVSMRLDAGIVILSLFCAGGLVAYVREILRLRRLASSGRTAAATVIDVEEIPGSESVVHYLVKYEFINADGNSIVHEQDLNSKRFFDTLKRGDTLSVVYELGPNGNSYPISQISSDIRLSGLIAAAIIIFWAVMATYFALNQ